MNDLFSLADKTALVTGGAQGLGRMITEGLLAAGASVYITSRKAEICAATAAELSSSERRCYALPGDAGSPEGIAAIGQQLRESGVSHLDVLVNNAGKTWGAPIESFPDRAWPSVMAVNVQAPFRMIQELLPELRAAADAGNPARVINIGSIAGVRVNDLQAYSYGASKAAVQFLTKQLARDLAEWHINVNAVLPGYFPTAMTSHLREDPAVNLKGKIPMRRLGQPEDIAGAVIFLSSKASSYVTGIELAVDGGFLVS